MIHTCPHCYMMDDDCDCNRYVPPSLRPIETVKPPKRSIPFTESELDLGDLTRPEAP